MYEYIEGELVGKSPTVAVLDVGGVGFRLHVPLSTGQRLPDSGRVRLWTHLYVREDAMRLFGFATAAERQVFLRLLDVPRVGPSLALAVLSGASLAQIRDAVTQRRPEILAQIKGIGKATAERVVQELQRDLPPELAAASDGAPPASSKARDVVSALLTLGYQRSSAERAAAGALRSLGEDAALERLVTEALKNI